MDETDFAPAMKEAVQSVLSRDYTSSDEEVDEKTRQTRPLSWESNKLREVKETLDQTFVKKVASYKQKQMMVVVRRGQENSHRARPSTAPEWTYKQ